MKVSPTKRTLLQGAVGALLLGACATVPSNSQPEEMPIWPGSPPNLRTPPAPETLTIEDHGWRHISIIRNVATPTVTVVRPARAATGAAMIILPGGGFGALAWDVEGTEVAQFLADRGVTAFILKYRVYDPSPEGVAEFQRDPTMANMIRLREPTRAGAAADGLQAVRFVRANADRFGGDPNRIGMMGFSAGAMTTFRALHEADDQSRPNIVAPIYGAMMEQGVPPHAPPMFAAIARDDGLFDGNALLALRDAWQAAGAAAEVHVFETGGHGFGMGRPDTDSMRFAALFEAWLRRQRFISQ